MTITMNNPTREAADFVGREGTLGIEHKDRTQEALKIPVRIADAKFVYGHTRVLAVPLHGEGKWWVDVSKVEFSR